MLTEKQINELCEQVCDLEHNVKDVLFENDSLRGRIKTLEGVLRIARNFLSELSESTIIKCYVTSKAKDRLNQAIIEAEAGDE